MLLELILEKWDAELDEKAKESLVAWKAEGDIAPYEFAERRGRAILHGEDKADIFFQIRPGKNGWLLWVMVGATMDERRRLIGVPLAPSTNRTTTAPSGE